MEGQGAPPVAGKAKSFISLPCTLWDKTVPQFPLFAFACE